MALTTLNDTTPAAPSGYQNAKWQADSSSPRDVSAYFPVSGGVLVKTTDYTAVAADCGKLIVFNSSSPHTLTLPAAAPFAQWNIGVQNIGHITHRDGDGTFNTFSGGLFDANYKRRSNNRLPAASHLL